MSTFYSHLRNLACLLLLLSTLPSYAQTEGTLQNYPTIVCPGEQTTIRLNVSDNVTVDGPPVLTNATLVFHPTKTSNVIDCTVRWNDVATQGTLVFKLKKEVKDSNDNIVTSYPPSPTVTVGIKSVSNQFPALINGSSTLDLPFCYTGQPIVLTVPQEYFVGAPSVAITDYIWQIPNGWQALNASPSAYHPGGFLGGRSITLVAPTGTNGGLVRAYQYSRACNENSSFQNAPGALISNARELFIRRPLPTITAITSSRPNLNCGDQRPLTLTATTSQPGANAFTWTLPTGWSFAPGSATNTASVSVVPSGSGGGTVSATATYNCVGYTTLANSTSIGYSPLLPAPTINPLPASSAAGIPGLCGPLIVTATAVGATEYYWSATNGILVNGAPTATVVAGASVTLTPPPGGVIGRGTVRVRVC